MSESTYLPPIADSLEALAAGRRLKQRTMIVAAHPDDETLGMGSRLRLLENALLVHVTDGAPRDGGDAHNYGFASCAEYAAARSAELAAALAAGEAGHIRREHFDIADQQGVRNLVALAADLAELIADARPAVIFTHAYEGGHPDHDAAAFAVHAARRKLKADGKRAPDIVEFALYSRIGGPLADFAPGGPPTTTVVLDADEMHRKRAMIACFATQRGVLAELDLGIERFRAAPDYDFTAPPPTGGTGYDHMGWGIDGPGWRHKAATALQALGLAR